MYNNFRILSLLQNISKIVTTITRLITCVAPLIAIKVGYGFLNKNKTKSPKQKSIQKLCERVEAEDSYVAEMSLGNVPQLGILLQDRRAERQDRRYEFS